MEVTECADVLHPPSSEVEIGVVDSKRLDRQFGCLGERAADASKQRPLLKRISGLTHASGTGSPGGESMGRGLRVAVTESSEKKSVPPPLGFE